MTIAGSHPAVFAGLTGNIAHPVPTLAVALPVDGLVAALSNSLILQFAVGCAIGAAVGGVIMLVGERLSRRDEDDEEHDDEWSSSLDITGALNKEQKEQDDAPTGDLGRYRTGQITIDLAALAEAQEARESQSRFGAHFAIDAIVKDPGRYLPRHAAFSYAGAFPPAPISQAASLGEGASTVRGRHFAAAIAQKPTVENDPAEAHGPVAESSSAAPVDAHNEPHLVRPPLPHEAVAFVPLVTGTSSSASVRARLSNLPVIESRRSRAARIPTLAPLPASQQAVPASQEQLATPVVQPLQRTTENRSHDEHAPAGITGRIRLRVKEVLADRLSADAMEGVPIITRADGSVGDVSPTWFDQAVVPKLASITGVTGRLADTAVREPIEPKVPKIQTETTLSAADRSAYIASHVAEVNVGMFPERRSADDLEHEDVWEEALAAMGESIARETPAEFQDIVGGPATIDDPEGLEGPTGFIPFRVPAAHPEVVDTDTYVDYLLRDEIAQNGSIVLSESPHAHLRVIDGGTGGMSKLHPRRRAGDTGSVAVHTGRHFAPSSLAQEA